MIDVFQNYEDVWQDADDIWYRGPFDDAMTGCVLVNPSMNETVLLTVKPLMAGLISAAEYLKGILTVKPYE